jgi:hypothetical protein
MPVWTQQDYETLCQMLGKGVTSMEVNGEKVSFRSLAEMRQIKGMMEDELGLNRRPRQLYPVYRKA